MDRLTTRNTVGIAVYKQSYDCEKCGESIWRLPDLGNGSPTEKLAAYEDAEDKGLLKKLLCGIGADIYYIPSKVNFDLNVLHHHEENNKVYHQNVASITYTRNGWYLECDKDIEYGTGSIFLDKTYGESWFLTEEEANNALAKLSK